MILPSDSDPPPERKKGGGPPKNPDEDTSWWSDDSGDDDDDGDEQDPDADADPDDDDDLDDPNAPDLITIAGPGWQKELYQDLVDCIADLKDIEDPDDDTVAPEPPDLYTFYGELAALRQEFRHDGERTQQALAKLTKTLPNPQAKVAPAAPEPWPVETCLALISAFDLLPTALSPTAYAATFRPLFTAAGLTKIHAIGKPFNSALMTRAGTAPATKKSPPDTVLQEITPGFLRAKTLLRPATVITAI